MKLPLKGVALQGGVAATLAGVELHCATTSPPPSTAGDAAFFREVVPERASQSCCHGSPSITEGISDQTLPASFEVQLTLFCWMHTKGVVQHQAS